MIKAKNYYDKRLNPDGKGIDHQFQAQRGDSVIFDAATGLTWQQGGSRNINYGGAEDYIKKINANLYGGYSDWRLPTLEEAMSLMKPEQKRGRYIAEQFDAEQSSIWKSDKLSAPRAWFVGFGGGYCVDDDVFVRAVR